MAHPRKAAESLAAFLEVADQVVIHSSAGTSHLSNRANLLQPLRYKLYATYSLRSFNHLSLDNTDGLQMQLQEALRTRTV